MSIEYKVGLVLVQGATSFITFVTLLKIGEWLINRRTK